MYCHDVPWRAGRPRQLHTAAPSASRARAHGARASARESGAAFDPGSRRRAAVVTTVAAPGRISASPNCAAVANRSAGSFDSAVSDRRLDVRRNASSAGA